MSTRLLNFLLNSKLLCLQEMELIYDLRGHMEQLYSEISELRKSIKGCMEMQIELQQSMKQEVQTGLWLCAHFYTFLPVSM